MRIKGIISEPGKGSYCIDIVIGAEDSMDVSNLRNALNKMALELGKANARAEAAEIKFERLNRNIGGK